MDLPKNWQISELKETLELIIDHRGITPKKLGGDWVEKGIPAISAMNINSGKLTHLEEIRYVDSQMFERWMPEKLQRGDILLTSEAPLGEAYFVENPHFCLSQRLFGLRVKGDKLNPKFLYYYIISSEGQKRLHERSTGTTAKGIRQTQLVKILIILPSLKEQQKIASILSNVDNLISSYDDTIEKTKKLKKGLMQQLLTKGINKTSITLKRLDTIISLQRGHDLPSHERQIGKIPVIGSNGIVGYHNLSKSKGPGVVIGRSGTLGKVYYVEDDYWPLNTSLYVKEFRKSEPKFVYYLLQTLDYEKFNAGTSVPTLNRNYLHPFKTKIPEKIEEQKKIAHILSSMDESILDFELKKKSLESLKKGLMQKLLTGQIRVKA